MRHSRHILLEKFRRDHYRRHLRRRELLLRTADNGTATSGQDSFAERRVHNRVRSNSNVVARLFPETTAPPSDCDVRLTREQLQPKEQIGEDTLLAVRSEDQVAAARSAARVSRSTGGERAFHRDISAAGTWYDSLRVLHEGVALGAHPTARTFRVLMDSVLIARARDAAPSVLGATFDDLAAEGSNERWQPTADERRTLARLCVQREEAQQHEASMTVQPVSRVMHEGVDDALVAALEHSMRKHQAVPSADVVADMALMRISWAAALRLLRFAREVSGGLLPPSEMYVRTMNLMTSVGKTSFGSRPWSAAIALYHELQSSGYDIPIGAQVAAQQALWRCCHHTWIRPSTANGGTITNGHANFVWEASLRLFHEHVARADEIVGDEGCRLFEASIRTMVHCGRWDTAIELLGKMDLGASDVTHRMLVPTPSCIAEATAGALRAGHTHHALALTQLFESYGYQWRTLPPETLRDVLTAARSSLRVSSSVAERLLEHILALDRDGGTTAEGKNRPLLLDRGVALACLGLVSNGRLPWPAAGLPPRWECALQLVASYDSNVWPVHPLERKLELAALFRAVRRVALLQLTQEDAEEAAAVSLSSLDRVVIASDRTDAAATNASFHPPPLRLHRMERMVQETWLARVFGRTSREYEWWENSLVHRIGSRVSWIEASRLYEHLVQRGRHNTKYLPVPMRQVRQELSAAVWAFYDARLSRSRGAVPPDDGSSQLVGLDADQPAQSLEDSDYLDQEEWTVNVEGTSAPASAPLTSQLESSVGDAVAWLQSVAKDDGGAVRHVVGALRMKRASLLFERGDAAAVKRESDAALYTLGHSSQKMLASKRSSLLLDASTALQLPVDPQVRDLLSTLHHQLRHAAWTHGQRRAASTVARVPRHASGTANAIHFSVVPGEDFSW